MAIPIRHDKWAWPSQVHPDDTGRVWIYSVAELGALHRPYLSNAFFQRFFGSSNFTAAGSKASGSTFKAQSVDTRRAEPESPEELMRFLSQTPILPLDSANPIELTRAVFQDK